MNMRRFAGLLFCILLLGMYGCATIPKEIRSVNPAQLLPSDESVYVFIDVEKSRAFAMALFEGLQLQAGSPAGFIDDFIERTDLLFLSVDELSSGTANPDAANPEATKSGEANANELRPDASNSAVPVIHAASVGTYPKGVLGWWAAWNRDWKYRKNHLPYWESRADSFTLSVPTRSLILFTNGSMDGMSARIVRSERSDFLDLANRHWDSADGMVVLNDATLLPELISSGYKLPANAGSIPLEQAVATYIYVSEGFQFAFDLRFESERDARIYTVVFKLLLEAYKSAAEAGTEPGTGADAEELPEPEVELNGSSIIIEHVFIAEADMLRILRTVVPFQMESAAP